MARNGGIAEQLERTIHTGVDVASVVELEFLAVLVVACAQGVDQVSVNLYSEISTSLVDAGCGFDEELDEKGPSLCADANCVCTLLLLRAAKVESIGVDVVGPRPLLVEELGSTTEQGVDVQAELGRVGHVELGLRRHCLLLW
jgi:hypothetical protein